MIRPQKVPQIKLDVRINNKGGAILLGKNEEQIGDPTMADALLDRLVLIPDKTREK